MKIVKNHLWDDKTNRLTILFILAALMIGIFTYSQYARRNYAISSSSQRYHNQLLKARLNHIQTLNHEL